MAAAQATCVHVDLQSMPENDLACRLRLSAGLTLLQALPVPSPITPRPCSHTCPLCPLLDMPPTMGPWDRGRDLAARQETLMKAGEPRKDQLVGLQSPFARGLAIWWQ